MPGGVDFRYATDARGVALEAQVCRKLARSPSSSRRPGRRGQFRRTPERAAQPTLWERPFGRVAARRVTKMMPSKARGCAQAEKFARSGALRLASGLARMLRRKFLQTCLIATVMVRGGRAYALPPVAGIPPPPSADRHQQGRRADLSARPEDRRAAGDPAPGEQRPGDPRARSLAPRQPLDHRPARGGTAVVG